VTDGATNIPFAPCAIGPAGEAILWCVLRKSVGLRAFAEADRVPVPVVILLEVVKGKARPSVFSRLARDCTMEHGGWLVTGEMYSIVRGSREETPASQAGGYYRTRV